MYQGNLYLIRTLDLNIRIRDETEVEAGETRMLAELERSIEYCVHQLKLPHPKQLFFTPDFHQKKQLFQFIKERFSLLVKVIDLTHYLTMPSELTLEEQTNVFYAVSGALSFNQDDQDDQDELSI